MKSLGLHRGACVLLLVTFVTICAFATDDEKASPVLINYQGLLQDPAGNALQGTYDMVFRLFTQETGGPYDWQEVHAVGDAITTDAQGVFAVVLNSTGAASGDLATLLKDSGTVWLEIEVQGETLAPRQRITASAYALSSPWSGLTGIPADFSDGTDDIAGPGIGLDQSGVLLNLETSYQLPQTVANGQIPKWNSTSSQWEAAEDNTGQTYTAGNGLILSGTQFNISYAGNGVANTVSRSDHHHLGDTWTGNSPLSAINTSTTTGTTAIHAKTSADAVNSGIKGETESNTDGAAGVVGLASGNGATYGVYGEATSNSPGSRGVVGIASGGGFGGCGVYGESQCVNGYGVRGRALDSNGFGVYSEGNAKVDQSIEIGGNYTYSSFKTGYISVAPAAFTTDNDSRPFTNFGNSFVWTGGLTPYVFEDSYAGVQLPHGVRVTNLKLCFENIEDVYGITLALIRTDMTGFSTELGSITGNSNIGQFHIYCVDTDVAAFNATVDNSTYIYFLRFTTSSYASIVGAFIEYEFDTLAR